MSESTPPAEPEGPRPRVNPVGQAQHLTEDTAQKLLALFESSAPVQRLRGSHVVSAFIGAVGFALFVVGVEQAAADLPIVSNPYGSIGVGVALLIVTGLFLRKLAGGGE